MSRLPAESHTSRRLEHATAEHLHLTTRRTFIGPVPEGWLKSHRKQWHRRYITNAGNRAPTFTAAHPIANDNDSPDEQDGEARGVPAREEVPPRPSSHSEDTQTQTGTGMATTSTTSLLRSHRTSKQSEPAQSLEPRESNEQPREHTDGATELLQDDTPTRRPSDALRLSNINSKLAAPKVRFNEVAKLQLRNRARRMAERGNLRSSKIKTGELLKMEKMLVRIDYTEQSIRDEYDENVSQGIVTRPFDKWREFMVACRKHTDGAVLQLYQTRVIAANAEKTKKKPKVEIMLNKRGAKVNMYSSLDKTLCIWTTAKNHTRIYYLRAQSGAASVEWYTFLRSVLGLARPKTLQVSVPDLNVHLRLENPFESLESSELLARAAEGDDEALAKAMSDEKGAAGAVVARCVDMLRESPEWADVLKAWAKYDRIGLAWKRYDRLEWVHGAVEQKMYGTIAMAKTHDLELRPKFHYPLDAKTKKGKTLKEPSPVEGFLIRLTSQKGEERRLGKTMFKRLYFTSQNQYLVFIRPTRALPPPPPRMSLGEDGNVPSTKELRKTTPLVYDIDPYPLDEEENIAWLDTDDIKSAREQSTHDQEAAGEADRNIQMLLSCDGFIDMCEVKAVRKFHKGAAPADGDLQDGSDLDFHEERDDSHEEGSTTEMDGDCTLELLMKNGLLVRLQAYNVAARTEWIKRLRHLVKYWHHRAREDMDLFKTVRARNLEALQIDESAEAHIGSFAYKWEVSQSYASPTLYHMCGIASCRTIHLAGVLFRKPRRHTTFTRCHVILSGGHLLFFQDTVRKRTGKKLVHIHSERLGSIDLRGCYLYSGLLTENDLLYQNRTFDANAPGHHALPRIFLEDSWTSTDEDAMTTFVIWHAKSKSWFRSAHSVDDVRTAERANPNLNGEGDVEEKTKTRLKHVSRLGATGRSVVFKARSRAERDHWVLALQVEIERLAAGSEEVRLVDEG